MKTKTYLTTVLAMVPLLVVLSPNAMASNEVCFEGPGDTEVDTETESSGSITCFSTPDIALDDTAKPSARATIYWQKTAAICFYWWETVVTAGNGLWTYAQGEETPLADQRGAVNAPGPINSYYSGNNIAKIPVPTGTLIQVIAKIAGTGGQASSVAEKVC